MENIIEHGKLLFCIILNFVKMTILLVENAVAWSTFHPNVDFKQFSPEKIF